MKYLLKKGTVVCPITCKESELDVLIDNGMIVRVEKGISDKKALALDASQCIVMPGFIDLHAHLREPGEEEKETLYTGAKAALAGGFVRVVCMPNTEPPLSTSFLIKAVAQSDASSLFCRVLPTGSLSKNREGKEIAELNLMAKAGAVAFSDDGSSIQSAGLMRSLMLYSLTTKKPLFLHEEDVNLSPQTCIHEGKASFVTGVEGTPSSAEAVMIARDILLAEETGARVHFQHLSSKESITLLRNAKKKGIQVTAEVTPHHLVLTEDETVSLNPLFKVNPPLRSTEDRNALEEALVEGVIDVIATDHAPHTKEEKTREFELAPPGIAGLETALPLLYTYFVEKKIIDLRRLVEVFSINPAKVLGKKVFAIREGERAELTVINTAESRKVNPEKFFSKSKLSPFQGFELYGWPEYVFVEGELRFLKGDFPLEERRSKGVD